MKYMITHDLSNPVKPFFLPRNNKMEREERAAMGADG